MFSNGLPMTETEEYLEAFLLMLSWDDREWAPLREISIGSIVLAETRRGTRRTLAVRTMSKGRQKLLAEGIIAQRRAKKKYYVQLTEKGEDLVETFEEESTGRHRPQRDGDDIEVPKPPFRVGGGHLFPMKAWKEIIQQVKEEELDLIVIPRKARTKIGYWDEDDDI